MGIFGWGSKDSEARKTAKMYGKLAETLAEKILDIESKLETTRAELLAAGVTFLSNSEDAEGLLNDNFELHEGMWSSEQLRILSNMEAGINDLQTKLSMARMQEANWNQIADMEEANAGF